MSYDILIILKIIATHLFFVKEALDNLNLAKIKKFVLKIIFYKKNEVILRRFSNNSYSKFTILVSFSNWLNKRHRLNLNQIYVLSFLG